MALEVYWTEFSERELENIFEYYKNKVSFNVAKAITEGIYNEVLKLEQQPEMG